LLPSRSQDPLRKPLPLSTLPDCVSYDRLRKLRRIGKDSKKPFSFVIVCVFGRWRRFAAKKSKISSSLE
jgi:hypothetical protein